MALSDLTVRKAKAKAYTLADFDGLSLAVAVNGSKSWHFRYQWQGMQKRMSLGTYPELSLRDARTQRDDACALLAKDIHPRRDRKHYLASLADCAIPEALFLSAFRLPYTQAIGIKLLCTPWTDRGLGQITGLTAHQLRQDHRDIAMPDDLAHILELAGEADVRILIFNADASVLDGLPLFNK